MQLFQPDNFSESKIKYKKVFGDFNFITILNHYFKEYTLNDIFQLDRPEVNSENYKVVLSIKNRPVIILIRKYKNLSDLEQIRLYLDLIEKMAKNGVLVSRVIKNENGELVMKVGEDIIALFEFIEGEYFSPTEERFASVAKAIAKMHASFDLLSENFVNQVAEFSEETKAYYNIIKEYSVRDFDVIREIIEKKVTKDDSDRAVLEKIPLFIVTVAEIKSFEKLWLSLPRKIIHSDLHPHNVLFKNNVVVAILDFDAVRISQRGRDVAFALYRFGRQFLVNKNLDQVKLLGPEMRDIFIKSYRQIQAISDEDVVLMPLLLKDEFINKVLLVLKGIYLEKNHVWAKDLSKFLVAVEEIDYFWPK
ncbi:MAG: Homoserine kinase [Candidatus Magasanikbacteria bacterium GW2011_GWC2_45_8]|uniref:Homoserine kinase n=1 Tax=Candidatus Magasanikbacteria bacterium GW2011_GWC2_45_8 TaxID=1619050 RepID=A0A0G1MZR8_9BACT|nr:MAG: Homoserine kinase [Candidatus Magasanikbacteria bacterium GW2011_GWC2_45_8]